MNVELFTSDTCQYCHLVKQYLDSRDISYTEYNVSDNEDYSNTLSQMGYSSVPVTVVDGEEIVGFNQSAFGRLFG